MEQFFTQMTVYIALIGGFCALIHTRSVIMSALLAGMLSLEMSWLMAWLAGPGTIPGGLIGQWLLAQSRIWLTDTQAASIISGLLGVTIVAITGSRVWYRLAGVLLRGSQSIVYRGARLLTPNTGHEGLKNIEGGSDLGDQAPMVARSQTRRVKNKQVDTRVPDHQDLAQDISDKPYDITPLPVPVDNKNDDRAQAYGQELATILQQKLQQYDLHGKVTQVMVGPVVTRLIYEPRADVRVSQLLAREDDVALALKALSLRILAPLPGTNAVAFEIARAHTMPVSFAQVFDRVALKHMRTPLPLVLGVDTVGKPILIDLAQQPHMLIAGTTGSGKSVLMHSFIISLLYRHSPDCLKLLMIDPKYLEYGRYRDCPHLLAPVAHQAQDAIKVLNYALKVMEERYQIMGTKGVRHAAVYHAQYGGMPPIVIIIDELADLMMVAGKDVERALVRLAQMARAASIHVIIATQRPSVDVVTGILKSNFPARIALKVNAKVDSRTILDQQGAEKLLGKGDLLYLQPQGLVIRAHGAYLSEDEIERIIQEVTSYGPPVFDPVLDQSPANSDAVIDPLDEALLQEMVDFVLQQQQISISLLQRRFRIGYNRSARLMQELEDRGYVVPYDGSSKMRKVLRKQAL